MKLIIKEGIISKPALVNLLVLLFALSCCAARLIAGSSMECPLWWEALGDLLFAYFIGWVIAAVIFAAFATRIVGGVVKKEVVEAVQEVKQSYVHHRQSISPATRERENIWFLRLASVFVVCLPFIGFAIGCVIAGPELGIVVGGSWFLYGTYEMWKHNAEKELKYKEKMDEINGRKN